MAVFDLTIPAMPTPVVVAVDVPVVSPVVVILKTKFMVVKRPKT